VLLARPQARSIKVSSGQSYEGIGEPTGRHWFFCATQRVHLAERGFANSHATPGSFSKRFAQRRHRTRWRVARGLAEARRESGSASESASEEEEEEEKEGERGDEKLDDGGGGGGGGGALAASLVGGLERAIVVAPTEDRLKLKLEDQQSRVKRALYVGDPFAVRFRLRLITSTRSPTLLLPLSVNNTKARVTIRSL
jgi:hypothetical protein